VVRASEAAKAVSVASADRLFALLAGEMSAVDVIIHDRINSAVPLIPNLSAYLIDAGGKRLRPMLALAAAAAVSEVNESARKLSAAVEFIHTATLLHDDVVDRSTMRRGKTSANFIWGDQASVLVGDFLYARAFNLMVETGDIRILDILARASCVIAEGEVMQLAVSRGDELPLEQYLQIIDAKTAALFAASAQSGAAAAGAPPALEQALQTFGQKLGRAFQLVDDALDYGGLSGQMGKNAGDDFREGKPTMPVIVARAKAGAEERAFWGRTMNGDQTEADFDTAVDYLHASGALKATVDAARREIDHAKKALLQCPPSEIRDALEEMADFCVERAF
jgi:octaprenyl-diphosphate synthase